MTYTEENYLKAIYNLQMKSEVGVVTVNEIAERLSTRPATVTDMMKKLSEKELINYQKYKPISLSDSGMASALEVVRKHRLWETFLFDKLGFNWQDVHEVAEQLEHIHSLQLIDALDCFLGFPQFDPHGDPIPQKDGGLPVAGTFSLYDGELNKQYEVMAVKDKHPDYLSFLDKNELKKGSILTLLDRHTFDGSVVVEQAERQINLSEQAAKQLMVVTYKAS